MCDIALHNRFLHPNSDDGVELFEVWQSKVNGAVQTIDLLNFFENKFAFLRSGFAPSSTPYSRLYSPFRVSTQWGNKAQPFHGPSQPSTRRQTTPAASGTARIIDAGEQIPSSK